MRAGSALFLLTFITAPGLSQTRPGDSALPNCYRVTGYLYRGAQPKSSGITELAAFGIRTIVDLRGEGARSRRERKQAEAGGLRYFNVPLPSLGRPTFSQVAEALTIIEDPANWPVFVHCRKGSDRTGMIIACYRVSYDGWTVDQAMDEAKHHGLHWLQYWMKDFIRDYARQLSTGQARNAMSSQSRSSSSLDGGNLDGRIGVGIRVIEVATRKTQNAIHRFFSRW
jgi:protein tyrosine phosphatase (PTP) superfamily phosphohydrolase (DUF442 family)